MSSAEFVSLKPFKPEDKRELQETRRFLNNLMQVIEKMDQCGVVCEQYIAIWQETDRALEAIEQHFMQDLETT